MSGVVMVLSSSNTSCILAGRHVLSEKFGRKSYISETWPLIKSLETEFRSVQREMEKLILGWMEKKEKKNSCKWMITNKR